ncbi:acyl carrier protein [Syntrophotalea acetylenica]|nr:acyl carrier protein [Syntrophotalea acetylenica]MDY0262760.1 acyl carrier protein [Syntrophotalea acetylenica]
MKEGFSAGTGSSGQELMSDASNLVRKYIVENFMFGDDAGLDDMTSLQASGIIDSTGILELVTFLEERFSIAISDEELIPQNLDSIHNVVCFLNGKCPLRNIL